jgi:hypothetical protein
VLTRRRALYDRTGDRQRREVWILVLPYPYDPPPSRGQSLIRIAVTPKVVGYLRLPERRVYARRHEVLLAAIPEAAIDEDRDA